MATYDAGFIYDDGNIYDTSGAGPTPVTPPAQDAGTVALSPPSKIVTDQGTDINGIYTFARVDEFDNAISDSISSTYNSDDLSLANVDSPSGSDGTASGGVIVDEGGTDVTMQQDTLRDPIVIHNAGSRFMR